MSQETKTVWQLEIALAVDHLKGHAGVATALGYPDRRNVYPWSSGVRMLPAEYCPALERATGGKAVCERLNPDSKWVRVPDSTWPHPDGRPLVDHSADRAVPAAKQEA